LGKNFSDDEDEDDDDDDDDDDEDDEDDDDDDEDEKSQIKGKQEYLTSYENTGPAKGPTNKQKHFKPAQRRADPLDPMDPASYSDIPR
jgi:hypothetical protein